MSEQAGMWGWIALSFGVGMLGYVLARLTGRLLDMTRAQSKFRAQNERVMALFHQRVELENELMCVDQEIAHIIQNESVDRAWWIQRVKEVAGALPPLVVAQMQRFGLAMAPGPIAYDEARRSQAPEPASQDRPTAQAVSERPPARRVATVTRMNDWTGHHG